MKSFQKGNISVAQTDNFLHTTHRTVSWFNKTHQRDELQLSAPFQRNPVWTDRQKAYLIDTILQGLPVPELYMVDSVDGEGNEEHIIVDGQQRMRACLDYIAGDYAMDGDDVQSKWRGSKFEDLEPEEKQRVFAYKFVVRVLPEMQDEDLRKIFARLNRNVVALNNQELRNATYWGPFIQSIQEMADEDDFWAGSGIFSANDHRRMLDHEYISELAIAYLHGDQNKKDKLDYYYQLYEEEFETRDHLVSAFKKITGEISQFFPELSATRWKKKSDFYTLFLVLAKMADKFPLARDERGELAAKISSFGSQVDALAGLQEEDWENPSQMAAQYTRAVARAASDKGNRVIRMATLEQFMSEHLASG